MYSEMIDRLCDRIPKLLAVAVLDQEGEILASRLSDVEDPDTIGPIVSSTLEIAAQSIRDLHGGTVRQVEIKGRQGRILLRLLPRQEILLMLLDLHASLEHLHSEIAQVTEEIAQVERG